MSKKKPGKNPFYVALVLVGVVFLVTTFCYVLMAFRAVGGHSSEQSGSRMLVFMDQHGAWLLGGELAVLILASLAAMATDSYWSGKNKTPSDGTPSSNIEKASESSSSQDGGEYLDSSPGVSRSRE